MIAKLTTVLLLALGVATGNVSSNTRKGGNAFNNEIYLPKEKPINKAVDNITVNLNWVKVGAYQNSQDQTRTNSKYYLDNKLSNDVLIGNLYSTSYSDEVNGSNTNNIYARNVTIIHITPYRNTINNTLTLQTIYRFAASASESIHITVWQYATEQNLDEYINLAVYNATEIEEEISNNLDQSKIVNSTNGSTDINAVNWQWNYYNQSITIESITDDIWIYQYAVTYNNNASNQNKTLQISPNELTWQGQYLQENYEVVDIPSVMFYILTMPFAFYSTAFNLTIFPNTPYAVNFGNLILTILGALILFYLIKKVIK